MLGKNYANNIAYKYKKSLEEKPAKYVEKKYSQVVKDVKALATALLDMGFKGKRVALIGENRYEWELAYLSVVCGVGIVVPMDKSLPANELEEVIERSEVEAIFYSKKYEETIKKIKYSEKNKLKHLISMDIDIHDEGIYSEKELIEKGKEIVDSGNREYINAKINPEEMRIMLFTSGTTSKSKVVALSHKNLVSNVMDYASVVDVDSNDKILSFLPLHHVYECTVGMLVSLYVGAERSFCDGIRHIVENLNEYKITYAAFVPAIYEMMYKNIWKMIEKKGKVEETKKLMQEYKDKSMQEKKEIFKEIHDMYGGCIKLFISGAAALDKEVIETFRNWGINLCQAYGLTETSPIIGIETNEHHRVGSIGRPIPHVEARIDEADEDGVGELVVKGPNVMLGYYNNKKATEEVMEDGWFHTGDLARIDEDGYIFICGRKKSVIVLKNGKNIYPEEMEGLVNKIEGVKESFIFGKQQTDDKHNIKIHVKIVFDKDIMKEAYKVESKEDIYRVLAEKIKEVNSVMPKYKAIRGIIVSDEPLIKTTTGKIKRQANLELIEEEF